MRTGLPFAAAILGSVLLSAPAAHAEPILAADPALDALAASYERQQDTIRSANANRKT
jgi:hypothetical protein